MNSRVAGQPDCHKDAVWDAFPISSLLKYCLGLHIEKKRATAVGVCFFLQRFEWIFELTYAGIICVYMSTDQKKTFDWRYNTL